MSSTFDMAELRRLASDPWGRDDGGHEAVAQAASKAYRLSRDAYELKAAEAVEEAEAILYALNIDNCFAPPLQAVPSVVWTTLMRGKLLAAKRDYGGSAPLSAEEMAARLDEAVHTWGAYNHPVLNSLTSAPLRHYQVWAVNWYGSCYGFAAQLAGLVQRTHNDAKKIVLENLSDEFDDAVTHDTLRERYYAAIDLSFVAKEALEVPDRVIEATSLLNLRTGLCTLASPLTALGCFHSVEANWPAECKRHVQLNQARGLDAETLEYWTGHAFLDEHHAAEWLTAIQATCKSDEERAEVVDGALIQLRSRWAMYDAIAARITRLQSHLAGEHSQTSQSTAPLR